MIEPSYSYSAQVVGWVAPDAVELEVDLGFGITMRQQLFLHGIRAPQGDPTGLGEALALVNKLAPVGSQHTIHTFHDPILAGFWTCLVHTEDSTINEQLVEAGLARPNL